MAAPMIYGLFGDRICQVMQPAMVETRFIASSGDGALGMTGQLKEVNN